MQGGLKQIALAARRRLRTRLSRIRRYEFWPPGVLYAPLAPYLCYLALRHGGPTVFTCCNPGITHGGGVIGESKQRINDALALASAWMLPSHPVRAGPAPHRRAAIALAATNNGLGGFPVVVKPDSGLRGHAVRIARDEDDLLRYFREMPAPAIVQRYHPGPRECGVMWVKKSASGMRQRAHGEDQRAGFIYSITRKEFPFITGDGTRTLEELIHDHPRFHCQAPVFLRRFAGQLGRVLAKGETVRLAHSGNHCQGVLFRDGSDLITPALEDAIDRIARSFGRAPGEDGPPLLDFGRFDIRYESDEALRRGEGFAIVELNGTGAESTNIYDPGRSIWWAWRVLAGQWRLLYQLGAERRSTGARPLPLRELLRTLRAESRSRRGPSIAD